MLGRSASLQSLRGLAAFAVLLFHIDYLILRAGQPALLGDLGAFGWFGVDLFFVLSGYLLAPRFLYGAPPSKPRFWLERLFRIGPAYYAACAISAALILADRPSWNSDGVWLNLVFAQNFSPEAYDTLNGVFWTLAVEAQYYVLLPFMALAFRGRRWPWGLALFLAVSLVFRITTFGHGNGRPLGGDQWLFLGSFTLPAFLGHFALGMAAARVQVVRRPLLIAALGAFVIVAATNLLSPIPWFSLGRPGRTEFVLLRIVAAVGFTFLVLACATPGPLRRMLELRPLEHLGDISYSLYLIHLPVLFVLFPHFNVVNESWNFLLVGTLASLGGGYLLHLLVEAPFEQWRKVWMQRRNAAKTPEAKTAGA